MRARVCTHVHVCACVYVCAYVCVHACMCACACVCTRVPACVCVCARGKSQKSVRKSTRQRGGGLADSFRVLISIVRTHAESHTPILQHQIYQPLHYSIKIKLMRNVLHLDTYCKRLLSKLSCLLRYAFGLLDELLPLLITFCFSFVRCCYFFL